MDVQWNHKILDIFYFSKWSSYEDSDDGKVDKDKPLPFHFPPTPTTK